MHSNSNQKRKGTSQHGETRRVVKHSRNNWTFRLTFQFLKDILNCPMSILSPQTRILLRKELCCTSLETMKLLSRWSSKAEVLQWDMFPESTELLLIDCSTEFTWTNSQTFWPKRNCVWGPVSHTVRLSFERNCSGWNSDSGQGRGRSQRKDWTCGQESGECVLIYVQEWHDDRERRWLFCVQKLIHCLSVPQAVKSLSLWTKWLRICMCIEKNVRAMRCCLYTLTAFTVVRTIWTRHYREEKI